MPTASGLARFLLGLAAGSGGPFSMGASALAPTSLRVSDDSLNVDDSGVAR